MIGETVAGRYEILRALGEGGMGAVFEARHTGTGRRVALKVIHPDKLKSKQLLARFEIEARAAGGVESEHVVQVFDVGVDEPRRMPFLAMEYLTGDDLAGVMDRCGRLPPELTLRIGVQVCLGLEKAHAQGVLHRDIKPANLLLAERDGGQRRIKIVDFGLAKVFQPDDGAEKIKSLTLTGMLLGSPQYMSPEQACASGGIDARTDVWSLGMVLYELVTGRTAFEDVTPLPKLLEAITSRPVPPIRMIVPEVELGIATAIERALEIDPARRYASVAELREALVVFLPGGWTLHESMFAGLAKAKSAGQGRKPDAAANQAATVAKRPAQAAPAPAAPALAEARLVEPLPETVARKAAPAASAPLAGAQPAPPTKVSVQPSPPPIERVATEPFAELVVRGSSSSDAPVVQLPAPKERTMASGELPREALALSGAGPRADERPRPAPRRWLAVATAAVAAAGVAAGAFWYLQLRGDPPDTSASNAARVPATSSARASASGAAGAPPSSAPVAQSPLLGSWQTDKGVRYDAVAVEGGAFELRVAHLANLAEQGYALGEARFTLHPLPGNPRAFRVVENVRPLPPQRSQPPQLSYQPASRASCVDVRTEVDGRALSASLDGATLIVERAVVNADIAKFQLQNTTEIVACQNLKQLSARRDSMTLLRHL